MRRVTALRLPSAVAAAASPGWETSSNPLSGLRLVQETRILRASVVMLEQTSAGRHRLRGPGPRERTEEVMSNMLRGYHAIRLVPFSIFVCALLLAGAPARAQDFHGLTASFQ